MQQTMADSLKCLALAGLAALWLTGCPNPNIYGTPRTVEPGRLTHTIAAEWIGYAFEETITDEATGEQLTERNQGMLTVPPTYILRIGLAERLDMGVRVNNMASLGVDLKGNFLRSDDVDLALAPGLQWLSVGFNVYHVHVPLLLGVNFSETTSLVLTPGVMYGFSDYQSITGEDSSELDRLLGAEGLYARAGMGVNIRISPKFAMQPEVGMVRAVSAADDAQVSAAMTYMLGVGFTLGRLPSYGAEQELTPGAGP
jgi:hypothetical protein